MQQCLPSKKSRNVNHLRKVGVGRLKKTKQLSPCPLFHTLCKTIIIIIMIVIVMSIRIIIVKVFSNHKSNLAKTIIIRIQIKYLRKKPKVINFKLSQLKQLAPQEMEQLVVQQMSSFRARSHYLTFQTRRPHKQLKLWQQ